MSTEELVKVLCSLIEKYASTDPEEKAQLIAELDRLAMEVIQ
jgi:phenylpyruvate tautomerase PptA (4-oxalocrotonate tautomerase family)